MFADETWPSLLHLCLLVWLQHDEFQRAQEEGGEREKRKGEEEEKEEKETGRRRRRAFQARSRSERAWKARKLL